LPISDSDIPTRLNQLESRESIRNLVARYAVLIDMRDIDNLIELYVPDISVGHKSGRGALRRSFYRTLGPGSPFTTTIHFVGGQTIDLDPEDENRATGVVYCRAEHEYEHDWIVATLQYWDTYQRLDGRWMFADRTMKAFYVVDVLERPNGTERVKHQLGKAGFMARAEIPESQPSWQSFWRELSDTSADR
jgi:hypothetical protein